MGVASLFIELHIRKEIWFEKKSISWLDNYKRHHRFHHIHHHAHHKEHIHGKKGQHLEHYIKKHLLDGEQMMSIKEYLEDHGWDKDIIKKASKNVLKDKTIMTLINSLNRM